MQKRCSKSPITKPISGCVRIACSGLTIISLLQVVNRLAASWKLHADLMQIADFTSLMQVANKLYQACEHQTCCNLTFADLLQVDETTCIKPACSWQLAARLLTTCNRLVMIKQEQAMRTHPDIGLVIADLLQLARFWLCSRNSAK